LPLALSAKNIPAGRTEMLNVDQNKRNDSHAVESDEDCAPETISDTKNWRIRNFDFDTPNTRKDDWEEDNKSDIELDKGLKPQPSPYQWNLTATQNVNRLIWLTWRSMTQTEAWLMVVSAMDTRIILLIKKK